MAATVRIWLLAGTLPLRGSWSDAQEGEGLREKEDAIL